MSDSPPTLALSPREFDTDRRPPAGARAIRWLARSFRGLTWGRFGVFCLLVLVVAMSEATTIRALLNGTGWSERVLGPVKTFAYVFLAFVPVLLAVVFVDNRGPRQRPQRIAAFAAGVLIGQALGTLLWAAVVPVLYPEGFLVSYFGANPSAETRLRYFAGYGVLYLGISSTATAFWYFMKRDLEAAATLHRASLAHEEVERERVEARFSAMQAQIEPHFLFNTLASVRRLYETDPIAGKAMLRHLTRYLTASLPVLRETTSVLGRELALAVAYLNVQKGRMGPRLAFDVDVDAALRGIVVPPMMLATLVENAVIHGLSELPAGGRLAIRARTDRGFLYLSVIDNGRGLKDDWGVGVGLANIRSRLASEFGDRARLTLTNGPEGGVEAELRIPLAPVEAAA